MDKNPVISYKVAIIGAGVAGLQTCRSLKKEGFQCDVYESANDIGGVWRENYSGMTVQVPRMVYEFPEFEMKSVAPDAFATSFEFEEYVKDYAARFNLMENIHLNTVVKKISQYDTNKWKIVLSTTGKQDQTTHADFLVCCTGMFSTYLHKPKLQGEEKFILSGGLILHTSEVTKEKMFQIEGKNVVIIGSAKSAQDLAVEVLTRGKAKSATMLVRHAHWGVPRDIAGMIPFQYIFMSRFGQGLVSLYKGVWPDGPAYLKLLSYFCYPFMLVIFKCLEILFAVQLHQYDALQPENDLVKDTYGYCHLPSPEFVNSIKKNCTELQKDEVETITENKTIILKNTKKEIPCDILILGTGFFRSYKIFDEEIYNQLDIQDDGLYLYRHIIPPNIENLAFCGTEVASLSNICTDALQAKWITSLLLRNHSLPSKQKMEQNVETMKKWKRSWMPQTNLRSSMVLLHMTHYHDTLLKDMHMNPHRKSNLFLEIFAPYLPKDYKDITA